MIFSTSLTFFFGSSLSDRLPLSKNTIVTKFAIIWQAKTSLGESGTSFSVSEHGSQGLHNFSVSQVA